MRRATEREKSAYLPAPPSSSSIAYPVPRTDLDEDLAEQRAESKRLAELAGKQVGVPDEQQVRALVEDLVTTLREAALNDEPETNGRLRAILEMLTGGRILVSQQGEKKRQRGWLRLSFQLHLVQYLSKALTGVELSDADTCPTIHVDLRKPRKHELIADDVKRLYDHGWKIAEIATKLKIGRNTACQAIRHWYESRGLDLPDFRSRGHKLQWSAGDFPFQRIADDVMRLFNEGKLYQDIAAELGVDRNTVTAAIRFWHEQRGLPVPDGRHRRKDLNQRDIDEAA